MLLTGTKPEPTFLVAKPFNADTVKAVIGQALFFEIRSQVKPAVKEASEPSAESIRTAA